MTNTNPETGIAYGVISCRNLDPDVLDTLWYGMQATDLSYESALADLKAEIERDADNIEEEVEIAIAETDYSLVGNEDHLESQVEAAYGRLGYDDREDYTETRLESERDRIQIDEPIIKGTYHGVKYRIDWLGGAPLLWVFESPVIGSVAPCSPCVPGAGDLDNPTPEGSGVICYDVPAGWRRED